jgi:hypothetical protein
MRRARLRFKYRSRRRRFSTLFDCFPTSGSLTHGAADAAPCPAGPARGACLPRLDTAGRPPLCLTCPAEGNASP